MESENKNAPGTGPKPNEAMPGFTMAQAIWLTQHGVRSLSLNVFAGPGEGYAEAKRAEKDLPTLAEEHLKAVDQKRADNATFERMRERWKAVGGRYIMQPTGKPGEIERVWQKYEDIPAAKPAEDRKASQFVTNAQSEGESRIATEEEAFMKDAAKKPDRQIMIERFSRQPYEKAKDHAKRLGNIYDNGSAKERKLIEEQFPHTLDYYKRLYIAPTMKEPFSVMDQQPDETPKEHFDRLVDWYKAGFITSYEWNKYGHGNNNPAINKSWIEELGGRSIEEYERFLKAKNRHIKVIKGMLALPFILAKKQREGSTAMMGGEKEHIADWPTGVKIHEGNEPAKPTFKPGGRLSEIPKGEFVTLRGGKAHYFNEIVGQWTEGQANGGLFVTMNRTPEGTTGTISRRVSPGKAKFFESLSDEQQRGIKQFLTFSDEPFEERTPYNSKATFVKRAPHANEFDTPHKENPDWLKSQSRNVREGLEVPEERNKREHDYYEPKEIDFARQLLNSLVENFPHDYQTQGNIVSRLEEILLDNWRELKAKRQRDIIKSESDLDNLNDALTEFGD